MSKSCSPRWLVVPSFIRLNLGHDAVVQQDTSGVYLNPMKATLDVLPSIANWELGGIGNLVRQKPRMCCTKRSQERYAGYGLRPGNQGQLIQGSSEFWDFVHHELSTVRVILDCGSRLFSRAI